MCPSSAYGARHTNNVCFRKVTLSCKNADVKRSTVTLGLAVVHFSLNLEHFSCSFQAAFCWWSYAYPRHTSIVVEKTALYPPEESRHRGYTSPLLFTLHGAAGKQRGSLCTVFWRDGESCLPYHTCFKSWFWIHSTLEEGFLWINS